MLTLVYGGARSGKSSYAVSRAQGRVCYIATAQAGDEEMRRRIEKHRRERPADWKTVETLLDIDTSISKSQGEADTVLVDCMSLYLSNVMARYDLDSPVGQDRCAEELNGRLEKIICAAREFGKEVIFVSNETGQGIVPDNPIGRFYRDLSGIMNQTLAEFCDYVVKVEVGIPITIKDSRHRP